MKWGSSSSIRSWTSGGWICELGKGPQRVRANGQRGNRPSAEPAGATASRSHATLHEGRKDGNMQSLYRERQRPRGLDDLPGEPPAQLKARPGAQRHARPGGVPRRAHETRFHQGVRDWSRIRKARPGLLENVLSLARLEARRRIEARTPVPIATLRSAIHPSVTKHASARHSRWVPRKGKFARSRFPPERITPTFLPCA